MGVNLIHKLLSLFQGQNDRFLVLEIFENGCQGALIKANLAEKQIKVIKIASHNELKKLIKKFHRLSLYKIIVALDSHLASTIFSSVVLVRDNFKELIDDPELDNLISQAIWRFFDKHRGRVAAKMNVTDLEVMLAEVKIRGIKLDGHKVVNPIGFKAKTVEVQFSQTFLLRNFIEDLKKLLPFNKILAITEAGTIWSHVISKANLENNFLLANIFRGKTLIFSTDGIQKKYMDRFNWGEENLKRSLAADLAVDNEIAGEIALRALNNQSSETFKRRLENLLNKELQILANGLNLALKRADTKILYLQPFFDLPLLFTSTFKNQINCPAVLKSPRLDLISKSFGFDIKFKHGSDSKHSFSLLANLMEWYLAPQNDKMSQLAKRRVRWLSPL